MYFLRKVRRGEQKTARHTEVQDDTVITAQLYDQKFTSACHVGNGLVFQTIAKQIRGRISGHLRAPYGYFCDRKSLDLWFNDSADCLNFW